MHDVAGDQRGHSRFKDRGLLADGELETSFDHVGHLLVRMLVHGHIGIGLQVHFTHGDAVEVRVMAGDRAVEDLGGNETSLAKGSMWIG